VREWSGAGWNQNWETQGNWKNQDPPSRGDDVVIDRNHQDVVLSDSSEVALGNLVISKKKGWHGILRLLMYGGSLNITGDSFQMAQEKGAIAHVVMCGGLISGGRDTDLLVGLKGQAVFSVNGGAVHVPGAVRVPAEDGEGRLNIHGGTFSCGTLNIAEQGHGLVDLTTGELFIDGDVRAQMQQYAAAGKLTAYNGYGQVRISLEKGRTCVRGTMPDTPSATAGRLHSIRNGKLSIVYDLDSGLASLYNGKTCLIRNFFSVVECPDRLTSRAYSKRAVDVVDGETVVRSRGEGLPEMKQYFKPHRDSFLLRTEISGKDLKSCWFSPLTVAGAAAVGLGVADVQPADHRVLIAPFDNAVHVRYYGFPVESSVRGYNVTSIYENTSRRGLVLGVVNSKVWKTGTEVSGSTGRIDFLSLYGGAQTVKDIEPHAPLTGDTISSPMVMVGYNEDWRRGLEAYADVCADFTPQLPLPAGDDGGIPLGWKSYGKYGIYSNINLKSATEISDYMRDSLEDVFVNEDGTVYVLLGAGGESRFKNGDFKAYVDYCHRNGQKAGSYFTPFKIGGGPDRDLNVAARGTDYRWIDLVLKDHSGKPIQDEAKYALDPTHPGTRQLIVAAIKKYREAGLDWLRMDFNDIGMLEGDHYKNGVTGMQAYWEGMEFVAAQNAGQMHLNLAISPVFPSQFAHSRRISNDVNDTVKETEYQLNSLAYGWWLDRVYSHNDPGNVAFDPDGDPAVAKMRMQAAVICSGQIVVVNDWSSEEGRRVSNPWMSNAQIMELARKRPAFYPVEGNTGGAAPNTLVWRDGSDFYIAVFNYSPEPFKISLDLERAGLKHGTGYDGNELWTGQCKQFRNAVKWKLKGYECRLYKLKEKR